ncbi:MAG: Uma2 family endonuclease [Bryobacteraceae bacterium]|nr:Uma2 family endonuclease [Bryobacteraceae bacterium]
MASSVAPKLTVEDYERLPQDQVHNQELIDGELVEVSGNTAAHIRVSYDLSLRLGNFIRAGNLGEVAVEMEFDFGGNVYAPDISFFTPAKSQQVVLLKRVQPFVPDLAVEVVSANDPDPRITRKAKHYRDSGVAEVWIIEPESREVTIRAAGKDCILSTDHQLTKALLPGFSIPVAELFQRLD